MVRPRASQAPHLTAAALAVYAAAGWIVRGDRIGIGQVVGPCAGCQQPTVRYGLHGQPLCPDCRPVRLAEVVDLAAWRSRRRPAA